MGWNIASGGARGHKIGHKHSQETKNKISTSNSGNIRMDLSIRNRISAIQCTCIICHKISPIGYLYRDHRNCFKAIGVKWSRNRFKCLSKD
jgi:hypothetical protein